MSDTQSTIHTVYHPTDFSSASIVAFHHALKLAVGTASNLEVLHVDDHSDGIDDWSRFPRVRDTLIDWGVLSEGASKADLVDRLGMDVTKTSLISQSISKSIAAHLSHHTPSISDIGVGREYQLVVMSTRGDDGAPLWLIPSVSESLSQTARAMTLFVVGGSKPFVDGKTGAASLTRILLPVDSEIDSSMSLLGVTLMLNALQPEAASVRAVFVGEEDSAPEINWAPPATVHFDQAVRSGPIADTILEEAEAFDADLIVMATQGRQGFLDALRGSTTDQVVRKAPCPVLAVPTI